MKLTIILTLLATLLVSCSTTTPSAKSAKPYPFDTCIVTDNELGSMGDPISLMHNGQEVKFCCAPCVKKFNKNPEKYLALLE